MAKRSKTKPVYKRYMLRKSDGYIYPYNPLALKADLSGSLQEIMLTEEQVEAWKRGEKIFEVEETPPISEAEEKETSEDKKED